MNLDLGDFATPEELPAILRAAAEKFDEAHSELQSAWQDNSAGRVWHEFAKIIERAADAADRAIDRYV